MLHLLCYYTKQVFAACSKVCKWRGLNLIMLSLICLMTDNNNILIILYT